jgi:ankyrin repeat protein
VDVRLGKAKAQNTALLLAMRAGHWELGGGGALTEARCERRTQSNRLAMGHYTSWRRRARTRWCRVTLMLYGTLPLIDARNRYRHCPLHSAVHHRHVRACRALLGFGANPCLRFDGISVIEMAAETGHRAALTIPPLSGATPSSHSHLPHSYKSPPCKAV